MVRSFITKYCLYFFRLGVWIFILYTLLDPFEIAFCQGNGETEEIPLDESQEQENNKDCPL